MVKTTFEQMGGRYRVEGDFLLPNLTLPEDAISSYEIQYATSSDGYAWGSWSALTTVSSSAASGLAATSSGITRGYYIKYQIRTRGAAGSSYYSAWKQSGVIRRNRLPIVPPFIATDPSPFEVGLTVSWGTLSDADGNNVYYELHSRTSADSVTWGLWATIFSGTNTSYEHTPPVDDGGYVMYRIRAVDTFGAASDYMVSAAVLRDDGAGFNITIDGVVYKAKAYVSVDGVIYKGKPFVSAAGAVYKGLS